MCVCVYVCMYVSTKKFENRYKPKFYMCSIVFIITVYNLHPLNVTTIMGQRLLNFLFFTNCTT